MHLRWSVWVPSPSPATDDARGGECYAGVYAARSERAHLAKEPVHCRRLALLVFLRAVTRAVHKRPMSWGHKRLSLQQNSQQDQVYGRYSLSLSSQNSDRTTPGPNQSPARTRLSRSTPPLTPRLRSLTSVINTYTPHTTPGHAGQVESRDGWRYCTLTLRVVPELLVPPRACRLQQWRVPRHAFTSCHDQRRRLR